MIPTTAQIMVNSSTTLMTEIAPFLPEGYGQGTAAAVAMLALFTAQEVDRAAEVRHVDITTMQYLFETAASAVSDVDEALGKRLYSASKDLIVELTISYLDERRNEYLELLIPLHALVETQDAPWAKELERDILNFLVASSLRRTLIIPQPEIPPDSVQIVPDSAESPPTSPRPPTSIIDFNIVKSVD
jgi:hypothetical protein